MKVRQGFISNSSSSSFIIGVGKVIDEEKLQEFLDNNNIELEDEVRLMTTNEIIEASEQKYGEITIRDKKLFVHSFIEYINTNFDPDFTGKWLIVNIINDEGDDYFEICDEHGNFEEYDYDIWWEDFPEYQQALITVSENNGVEDYHYTYGAGRNG